MQLSAVELWMCQGVIVDSAGAELKIASCAEATAFLDSFATVFFSHHSIAL